MNGYSDYDPGYGDPSVRQRRPAARDTASRDNEPFGIPPGPPPGLALGPPFVYEQAPPAAPATRAKPKFEAVVIERTLPASRIIPPLITAAICKVMHLCPAVAKAGDNKEQKFTYVRYADVVGVVQRGMIEAGLVLTQREVSQHVGDHLLMIHYEFDAAAFLSDADGKLTGETMVNIMNHTGVTRWKTLKGFEDDKAWNKAQTAAAKYVISKLFMIPPEDQVDLMNDGDADGDGYSGVNFQPLNNAPQYRGNGPARPPQAPREVLDNGPVYSGRRDPLPEYPPEDWGGPPQGPQHGQQPTQNQAEPAPGGRNDDWGLPSGAVDVMDADAGGPPQHEAPPHEAPPDGPPPEVYQGRAAKPPAYDGHADPDVREAASRISMQFRNAESPAAARTIWINAAATLNAMTEHDWDVMVQRFNARWNEMPPLLSQNPT